MFERDDWMLFRNLATLGQKAGVAQQYLLRLVLKELADNAMDAGAEVEAYEANDGSYVIEDNGPGLPIRDAQDVARLFSIKRPLTSSKLLRLPSRGALGNGLRVVVGAVLASRGSLVVETRGVRYEVYPSDDGTSTVHGTPGDVTEGTRITVKLGEAVPDNGASLMWVRQAQLFFNQGKTYKGKTSAWWYDGDSFFELFQAAVGRSTRQVLGMLREFSGKSIPGPGLDKPANETTREEALMLLTLLRAEKQGPSASTIGSAGDFLSGHSYASVKGEITLQGASAPAHVPFNIEAYVRVKDDDSQDEVLFLVNRTPITGRINVQRGKFSDLGLIGCGLKYLFPVGRKPVSLVVNLTTPYCPLVTDGKEPNLELYVGPLHDAMKSAANKAKRREASKRGPARSQKEVIQHNLYPAIDMASGDGRYRYSLRQLFYAIRPHMLDVFGKEPDYNYFAQVITDIEAEEGRDLPGLYRDARGMLYHPHTGEEIPLGTLNVEKYKRPSWTFSKVLYCEKEGLVNILKEEGWPERNDCALLSSKGFASRAARDVIDLMGETGEDISFFCLHDADSAGTLIYQALTEGTRARGARKVNVVNLGLDPWEAVDMGLQVETFRTLEGGKKNQRLLPVASYVPHEWANWLQTQRVELNAMSSPVFLEWIDRKFAPYVGKVKPPAEVLKEELDEKVEGALAQLLTQKLLAEGGFAEQLKALVAQARATGKDLPLTELVDSALSDAPEKRWSAPIADEALALAVKTLQGGAQ